MVYLHDKTVYHVEGFSSVHERILEMVGLPPDLYTSLAKTVVRVPQTHPAA